MTESQADREDRDSSDLKTDLAEDRTVLANERTFASWLRTGFGAIGIGLAFNALFVRLEPTWIPKAIATAFLIIALLIFIAAERRVCAVMARLNAHRVRSLGVKRARVISYLSAIATIALIVALWLLRIDPGR